MRTLKAQSLKQDLSLYRDGERWLLTHRSQPEDTAYPSLEDALNVFMDHAGFAFNVWAINDELALICDLIDKRNGVRF